MLEAVNWVLLCDLYLFKLLLQASVSPSVWRCVGADVWLQFILGWLWSNVNTGGAGLPQTTCHPRKQSCLVWDFHFDNRPLPSHTASGENRNSSPHGVLCHLDAGDPRHFSVEGQVGRGYFCWRSREPWGQITNTPTSGGFSHHFSRHSSQP